jgi:hypothetical protein
MPFLAKYADYKHMTTTQLQAWVNSLTPAQVDNLSKCLLQSAGDSNGDLDQFTNGPAQTTFITDPASGWSTPLTLANTAGVLDSNLAHDRVPHP